MEETGPSIRRAISIGVGLFNRSPTVVTRHPALSYPGLDRVPILLLSSGCDFFARDTRATTTVEAAVSAALQKLPHATCGARRTQIKFNPEAGKAGKGRERPQRQRCSGCCSQPPKLKIDRCSSRRTPLQPQRPVRFFQTGRFERRAFRIINCGFRIIFATVSRGLDEGFDFAK